MDWLEKNSRSSELYMEPDEVLVELARHYLMEDKDIRAESILLTYSFAKVLTPKLKWMLCYYICDKEYECHVDTAST